MKRSMMMVFVLLLSLLLLGLSGCGDDEDEVIDGDVDGDNIDGDEIDGDTVDGDTDGDAVDGDMIDGDTVDGDTDGDAVDGDMIDGDTIDGDTDGDAVDGDMIDGDTVDGDTDGDAVDGDMIDGDAVDGDTDGDAVDGDMVDGDVVDGDTDGEVDLCDGVNCFDNATCDEATGNCVCDEDYENWTDGVGCTMEALDVTGSYDDGFGGHHEITQTVWTQSGYGAASHFFISQYSNANSYLIAQNGPNNAYSPEKWSRFDWTWYDDGSRSESLWYCQTVYGADTEADALNTPAADSTDPSSGGCGGFSWSKATPGNTMLTIFGSYQDSYDGHHEITQTVWTQSGYGAASHFFFSQFSNADQYAIAQNGPDNAYSPDKWSRYDWTWYDDGEGLALWYCQTAYGADTEADALATEAADATDPSSGGCSGYSWSKLSSADTTLTIFGSYADNYGGGHEISDALWTQGGWGNASYFHITQFSNDSQYAIAQNNTHNAYNPDKWSRFDWTWYDSGSGVELWYCQTAYGADTEADALATAAADATDPSSGGCGGLAWSKLTLGTSNLILVGDWLDNFGMNHTISGETWFQSTDGFPEYDYNFEISQFSNVEMWVSAQNDTDNPTGGDKWSRIDWTWYDAGSGLELWYCQTVYDADTENDALSAARADETDPSSGGCGASSWSKLTPYVDEAK